MPDRPVGRCRAPARVGGGGIPARPGRPPRAHRFPGALAGRRPANCSGRPAAGHPSAADRRDAAEGARRASEGEPLFPRPPSNAELHWQAVVWSGPRGEICGPQRSTGPRFRLCAPGLPSGCWQSDLLTFATAHPKRGTCSRIRACTRSTALARTEAMMAPLLPPHLAAAEATHPAVTSARPERRDEEPVKSRRSRSRSRPSEPGAPAQAPVGKERQRPPGSNRCHPHHRVPTRNGRSSHLRAGCAKRCRAERHLTPTRSHGERKRSGTLSDMM